jgi:LuxR family maltose regulon positive regulatory protein
MELNYLQSKIQNPRIQPDLVARPHLIELIEKGLWRKLTILCAPPGFGKSTLIAEWSLMTKNPLCWFQVDAQDNLLDNFLIYLCNSIRQVKPDFLRLFLLWAYSLYIINDLFIFSQLSK